MNSEGMNCPTNVQQTLDELISDEEITKAAQHFENLKRWLEHEEEDRKCVENQIELAERDLNWQEVDLLKSKLVAMKNSERVTELLIMKASSDYRRLQGLQVRQKSQEITPEKCSMIGVVIITDLKGNPHSRTDLSEIYGQ
uniref:Uncharacterized protein n=1 Tax=Plectus sambesii TaxID=2011161 RepID=A0A914UKP6_9BILA